MAIKLELEIKEAEIVIAGLYKLSMEIAEPIVNKIKTQAIPQVEAQNIKEEADKPVVEIIPAEALPEQPAV